MKLRIILLLACAIGQSFHAVQAADAPPPRPTVEDFFGNPEFSDALLSPSGKYLAVKVGSKDKRDLLAVVELGTNTVKVVGNFSDADIGRFQWINDERLAFTAADHLLAQGDQRYAPGLYAINRDGTAFRQLAMRSGLPFVSSGSGSMQTRELLPWHTYMLDQDGPQDSEYMYVLNSTISGPGQVDRIDLQRVNTLTGRVAATIARPGDSMGWLLDNKGEPRVTQTSKDRSSEIWYRDPANNEWRKLTGFDSYTGGNGAFTPLAFGPDGTLYVISNRNSDLASVHSYDLATNKVSEQPIVKLDGYDFNGHLIMDQHKMLGVRYLTDARGTVWFDPAMKAMQESIDAMLPNTINLLTPPTRPQAPWVLVTSFSDVWPSRTFLYNRDSKQLNSVGSSYPAIKPTQMAHKILVHYKARDGLDIPAWLTVPQGSGKNLPMVVLVHGGPYVRGGNLAWEPEAQFLASRGYAVLEPEYRGSRGFGARHYHAGWKQWGLKMQDDIADGARWAIAQGTVDPKRICIAGASYGGYATLMGLINDPALFQCGVDWLGVTDINLMRDGHWAYVSDFSDVWRQYGMAELVGDPVKDAEQLKATSPLLQAARIKQPLLLAYGGADMRVPLPHGTKFYNAVKQTNPDVEWVEYPDEGHGWALPKTRFDFWKRVEKFLDKHIGPGAAQ
ncbi:alpha/beta fold hydrolase [Duganella sp. BJB475]|uniref:S9 family peptidase n=1 Tax=Duganella sp. BJB475 TaxID=2233914 RepID=UPI000E346AF7|nr:alpha/beta fold hydrolase [Duganella sp. BJB475]RFP11397.1 S9 family peptidase [Duganella sp. BJB475]